MPRLDYGDPSRTTVALDGSVWVGNREEVRNNLGSDVRVRATKTRHLSIDADNNLWVSGLFGAND
ncbi:MAG: hypothetical protein GY708_14125 [Actinomycetia bacterium]|nr:hypothetical protein [Actinomycetes bacterium]